MSHDNDFKGGCAQSFSRWTVCLLMASCGHLALGAVILLVDREESIEPMVGQGIPMAVQLAAVTAAPATDGGQAGNPAPSDNNSPDEQVEDAGEPEPKPETKPEPQPEPEPEIEQEIEQESEIEPEPNSRPEPVTDEASAPADPASPGLRAEEIVATEADTFSAPATETRESSRVANARVNWWGKVNAELERHKRYPHRARSRREQGTAVMRFRVDRQGYVVNTSFEQRTGFTLLDQEIQETLRRAQPLPEPPDDVPGETVELVWKVEFAIR